MRSRWTDTDQFVYTDQKDDYQVCQTVCGLIQNLVPYIAIYTITTLTLLVLSYTLDGLRSQGITRVALSSYLVLLHQTVCSPKSYLYRFLPLRKTHDLNYLPSRFLLHETLQFERPLRSIPFTFTKYHDLTTSQVDSYFTDLFSTSTSYLYILPLLYQILQTLYIY